MLWLEHPVSKLTFYNLESGISRTARTLVSTFCLLSTILVSFRHRRRQTLRPVQSLSCTFKRPRKLNGVYWIQRPREVTTKEGMEGLKVELKLRTKHERAVTAYTIGQGNHQFYNACDYIKNALCRQWFVEWIPGSSPF
ncbi:hypothetical protein RvY_17663 [Ramazzottius varieornatus]|uniref:Uncharacterized protein n=1 Tax=Ramazzottius varieornatus TaxID=947166 RepID=A0A1D1W2X6_RAMVA|nr:hypothetical protein RvY_17663 [Ramazzottius varieornatus]